MNIVVLGGDGFCGWPLSLRLSSIGHKVTIIDDFSRREIAEQLNAPSLTPIQILSKRVEAWHKQSSSVIAIRKMTVGRPSDDFDEIIGKADAVVHLAEQSSAPWSMRSAWHRRKTVMQNIGATQAVLAELRKHPEIHLVHLGTMGVYGYSASGDPIPEGWIEWQGKKVLHPFAPGSIYHASKCMDAILLEFSARNDGLRITDLHQGIIWGTQTEETKSNPTLINRFSWDGDYGTVLNRFLMQAAVGYPLTVHGSGGQTRAFIHLTDSIRCICKALENPPANGEYRVFNQAAEALTVKDLALKVSELTSAEISYVENPRKEADENDLSFENAGLVSLGWEPILLSDELMTEIYFIAEQYKGNANKDVIPCRVKW